MGGRKFTWPEAKKLCQLNQDDIEMAKRLGLHPDVLVRARPDPKQKWKLPVKYWIRELHLKRFGNVLGAKPVSVPSPISPDEDLHYMENFFRTEVFGTRDDDVPF